ncbi:MAG: alpha/beta hydrolase fold domain-containing protein [Spirochaetaceae bacterium]|jgi:acetyl esterase/lipase|nr:alpha/beta hydrolase fold domain-containing protein [Spirochaetaceae bacterium]
MKGLFSVIPLIFLVSSCLNQSLPEIKMVNIPISEEPDRMVRIYKEINDLALEAHIFLPEGYQSQGDKVYPVAAWFHGGAWVEGTVDWGYDYCGYLASLGMVAVSFEYRLADRETVSSLDCMKDVNSAIKWLRLYSEDLRVNPDRILSLGDSAGAHLAISTAMFPNFQDDNVDVSSQPNLVFAIAPPVKLNSDPYFKTLLLRQERAKNCSPLERVRSGLAPMYLWIGTEDEIVPHQTVIDFEREMLLAGNEVELQLYPGGSHSFHWADPAGEESVKSRMREILLSKQWISL